MVLTQLITTAEWKTAYPEAKMIGVEGLEEKKKGESWKFDHSGFATLRCSAIADKTPSLRSWIGELIWLRS
jgi:hypothetical protein